MLQLLVVSFSLLALSSAQPYYGWVQLGDHPLLTTMIRYFNQTLPCTGPCILDSIDYIIGESLGGEDSANGKCITRFIKEVEVSFPPPPPTTPDFEQYNVMQWLLAIGRPDNICPKLAPLVSCFASTSENVCGRSSRLETEMIFRSLLTFLDCNIPVNRQLRLFECLVPPVTALTSQAPLPGLSNFTQCTAPAINYFSQGYPTVYRDISGANFDTFESHVRSLVQCFLEWNPSSNLFAGRCDNAVAHVYNQLNSIMDWLRDGDGRSMFVCLGDLTLYMEQPMERCINTFTTEGGDLIRRISDEISNRNVANVRNLLKELSTETCRTRAVPNLVDCMERVLVSRPERRCSEVVVPTFRHAYMPSLQYVYLLGGCSSNIPGGALSSSVCQCARGIPDYSFRPEVSSQCQMRSAREAPVTVLSLELVVIIVVVGVVGVLLVVVLLVCCCCGSDCSWCCRTRQQVRHEKTVIHVPATNYMHPAVSPGLCVQQAPVLSPYGHCSCQSPPTRTILQLQ